MDGIILERLRRLEPELRAQGLVSLFLFGSTARGEARPDSDVDLFCDLDRDAGLGFGFFALTERLSSVLGLPVDLTTRDGLHPLIRERVVSEAVRVF